MAIIMGKGCIEAIHGLSGVEGVKVRVVANWSDPMLAQTVKGIKNVETVPEDVKDPLTE